jgi:hypothetical protein
MEAAARRAEATASTTEPFASTMSPARNTPSSVVIRVSGSIRTRPPPLISMPGVFSKTPLSACWPTAKTTVSASTRNLPAQSVSHLIPFSPIEKRVTGSISTHWTFCQSPPIRTGEAE